MWPKLFIMVQFMVNHHQSSPVLILYLVAKQAKKPLYIKQWWLPSLTASYWISSQNELNQWLFVLIQLTCKKRARIVLILVTSFRFHPSYAMLCHTYIRADSRLATSQWETSLQSNSVSHWLGANLESSLYKTFHLLFQMRNRCFLTLMSLTPMPSTCTKWAAQSTSLSTTRLKMRTRSSLRLPYWKVSYCKISNIRRP